MPSPDERREAAIAHDVKIATNVAGAHCSWKASGRQGLRPWLRKRSTVAGRSVQVLGSVGCSAPAVVLVEACRLPRQAGK